jgi:hypothetical protein
MLAKMTLNAACYGFWININAHCFCLDHAPSATAGSSAGLAPGPHHNAWDQEFLTITGVVETFAQSGHLKGNLIVYFYAAPAKNFDAAPIPTVLYSKEQILK